MSKPSIIEACVRACYCDEELRLQCGCLLTLFMGFIMNSLAKLTTNVVDSLQLEHGYDDELLQRTRNSHSQADCFV